MEFFGKKSPPPKNPLITNTREITVGKEMSFVLRREEESETMSSF
jgi:hypothetical protein